MKILPPYHLVLIPRFSESSQSIIFAQSLAKIHSETNTFQVIDFDGDYKVFISQPAFPNELKDYAHFIEVSRGKFLVPGTITFVANFDGENLGMIISNFKIHKPDLDILVLLTQTQFVQYGIFEELDCVDVHVHQGSVEKSLMEKLGMITESH